MKEEKEKGRALKALDKSPINYFSDLFIAAMVIAWIVVAIIMVIMAIFSTVVYADNSIWCELGTLVAVPLSCGGGIWMIKNSVQHAIASNKGEKIDFDFPATNAEGEADGMEQEMEIGSDITDEESEGLG